MPNHVQSDLTFHGPREQIAALVALMTNPAESNFDFNRILPMPEELANTVSGGCMIDGEHVSVWKTNAEGMAEKIPDKTLVEWADKYGAIDWYQWANCKWGTKWNAYDVGDWQVGQRGISAKIRITTAWAPPDPVFRAILAVFPGLSVTVKVSGEVDRRMTYKMGPAGKN